MSTPAGRPLRGPGSILSAESFAGAAERFWWAHCLGQRVVRLRRYWRASSRMRPMAAAGTARFAGAARLGFAPMPGFLRCSSAARVLRVPRGPSSRSSRAQGLRFRDLDASRRWKPVAEPTRPYTRLCRLVGCRGLDVSCEALPSPRSPGCEVVIIATCEALTALVCCESVSEEGLTRFAGSSCLVRLRGCRLELSPGLPGQRGRRLRQRLASVAPSESFASLEGLRSRASVTGKTAPATGEGASQSL